MAAGEFTLVRSKNADLEIQVRQQPYPGSKWVSVTSGAAMRVAGNRVVIFKGSPLQVRVNGRPMLVTNKGMALPRGGRLRNLPPELKGLPRKLEVTWPDGTFAQVWEVGDSGLALLISPAPGRAGVLAGLLGNSDGKQGNDFATRAGRRLAPNVIRRGARGRAYRVLYRQYGDSWRTTRRTSLFDYAPGQSPATFTNRRFPAPAPTLTLAARDKKLLARAQSICRRMRIKDPAVEASCVVDVLLTGDFNFAARPRGPYQEGEEGREASCETQAAA